MVYGLTKCSVVKNLPAKAGDTLFDPWDMGSIPGSGSPLEKEMRNDNPL